MPLARGTQLGPYEISTPLGTGGMGEVYRARDMWLERTVAVKILPPHLSSDPVRKLQKDVGRKEKKQAEFKADSGNSGNDFARVDTLRPRGVHFGRDVIASLSRSDAGVDEGCCGNEGRVHLGVGSARQRPPVYIEACVR